jgi:myo-inositol-1(or 4)-monophosphatase
MGGFLETAEKAARLGGETLLKWRDNFSVSEKSPRNLVTQADLESQVVIQKFVLAEFPDHQFLGEEDLGEKNIDDQLINSSKHSEFCWIVDPLDGTTNYVHQLPSYSVSVALCQDNKVIAGAVFDPVLDECFTAELGKGAMLNGNEIIVSDVNELQNALVVASMPSKVTPTSPAVRQFLEILYKAQSVRRLGSAALNLCYVAMGRLDAYWATSIKSWDVAAGSLILTEAGGSIGHVDGKNFDLHDPRMIAAANDTLRMEIQNTIN